MPIRIGPTSSPPRLRLEDVAHAADAASVLAKTSTFAAPSSREFGKIRARSSGSSAASDMHLALVDEVAPLARRGSPAPPRIRRPDVVSRLPNCDASTARPWASSPKRRTWRAARDRRLSAICSGVGSGCTWVSATKSGPSSRIISDSAPIGRSPPRAEHLAHVVQVPEILAEGAADQAVGLAAVHHDRGDRGGVRAHDRAGEVGRDAAPLHDLVIGVPVLAVARVVLGVHEVEVPPEPDRQPVALAARLDHLGAADQDRAVGRSPRSSRWPARSTRSSSPSAKTMRRSAVAAASKTRPHDEAPSGRPTRPAARL